MNVPQRRADNSGTGRDERTELQTMLSSVLRTGIILVDWGL